MLTSGLSAIRDTPWPLRRRSRPYAGHANVPCGHGDRLARGMRAVDKRCLLWAFSQKHQDVIIGMDPSQAPLPRSMTEVTRRGESPVDLQDRLIPAARAIAENSLIGFLLG